MDLLDIGTFPQFCCWLHLRAALNHKTRRNWRKTAQATAEVKNDAEAVAAGVREGWSRDKPLDLNTATKEQLLSLPGVTEAEANRVIAGRPYTEPGDVVTRRIMPKTGA